MVVRISACRYMVILACPHCRLPFAVGCVLEGTIDSSQLRIITQACCCDPYDALEDLWEQARMEVFHL